jgi:hypothetical protein
MAGHAKAKTDRCPSWRQLYRITCTLCEAAGIEAPKSAAAASELIARLDAITGASEAQAAPEAAPLVVDAVGSDCPF